MPRSVDAAALPFARRNWLAHAIEGGVFMGALALVNAQTLLPTVVDGLGGPAWLVAAMPVLMIVGFTTPSVLTAHHVGRLGRFHPLLLWTGIPQRLPYLLAALALLFAGDRPPLCLTAVALAPLLSGMIGGISATGWQQLVARTVPPARRPSLFAVRFAISSLMGVGAGYVVGAVLERHPGTTGYGLLHLGAFLLLMVSYGVFACIREPHEQQAREPETGLWRNLRGMHGLVAGDRHLGAYLLTTTLFTFAGIAVPFLGIHALRSAGEGEAFLGSLISWQMGGAVVGGLAAGWYGDRRGGRPVMTLARVGFVALFAIAPWVSSPAAWCWLFALFGAAGTAGMIGTSTVMLAILPSHGRANRLAVMGFAQMPVALLATFAGAWLWRGLDGHAFAWLAAASAVAAGLSLAPLARLSEPEAPAQSR